VALRTFSSWCLSIRIKQSLYTTKYQFLLHCSVAFLCADGGKKTVATTSSVIETKPTKLTSTSAPSTLEIKPSKTTGRLSENEGATSQSGNTPSSKRLTSNVEVKAGPPATILSSVVEVRGGAGPSSVVNANQRPSSIVQTKGGVSSVVDIRGGTPTGLTSKAEVRVGASAVSKVHEPSAKVEVQGPSSVVEVKEGPSKILFSRVEVVGGEIPPSVDVAENHQDHQNEVPTIFSSVVEVRSSSEEPALSGNNIVEPEYDFLSRQPSEVVDETFKVSTAMIVILFDDDF
jgi:hypothetical protein